MRENLFVSLLVHVIRSLDHGQLSVAKTALAEAVQLIPNDTRLEYLQEATSEFSRGIVAISNVYTFTEVDTTEFESRSVEIEGVFGEQVNAFALTAKSPGFYNTYDLTRNGSTDLDMATRVLVYPTGDSGIIYLTFGRQANGSLYAFTMNLVYGGQWALAQFDATTQVWTTFIEFQYVQFAINQWHTLEVWTRGQVTRLFVDRVEVGKESLLDFEPGIISFGVGVDVNASSAVFSSAFMDMTVYEMAN